MSETATTVIGFEEAKKAADTYRNATTEIEKIENTIRTKQAEVASRYETQLNAAKGEQEKAAEVLEQYLGENKEELLQGNARSFMLAGIKIGYRKAKAKLVLAGKTSWDKVLDKLKASTGWSVLYVKTKEEIDKTALAKADAEVLKEVGVKVEQNDSFYASL